MRTLSITLLLILSLTVPAPGQDEAIPLPRLRNSPYERGSDAQVRDIIQQALDDALHAQVQHLFATWMKDDQGQPKRAAVGIRKAVAAYRHAIQAIETENLTWNEQGRSR